MKTSTLQRGIPTAPRGRVFAFLLFPVLSLSGCGFTGGLTDDNVPEGQRCNPLSSHNECASGLMCSGYVPAAATITIVPIDNCPENYCCSVDSNGNINSSDPNCQVGCNGGAASICMASMMTNVDACAAAGIDTGVTSTGDGGE